MGREDVRRFATSKCEYITKTAATFHAASLLAFFFLVTLAGTATLAAGAAAAERFRLQLCQQRLDRVFPLLLLRHGGHQRLDQVAFLHLLLAGCVSVTPMVRSIQASGRRLGDEVGGWAATVAAVSTRCFGGDKCGDPCSRRCRWLGVAGHHSVGKSEPPPRER